MPAENFKQPVRKAVFPVAGLGTRCLPATKVMPKEMLTLVDRPLIQHAVEEARDAGIEEFIFVTGPGKEMLAAHFEQSPALVKKLKARDKTDILEKLNKSDLPEDALKLAYQEEALGLGHAIWCARELVGDEPFAVILPDDVFLSQKSCLAQMVEAYNEIGGNLMAVTDVSKEDTARYGIVDIKEDHGKTISINNLIEKPDPDNAPSQTAIMGRYILQPEIFDHLSAHETGAGGEIQLTDSMVKLIESQPFHGFRYEGQRYDCGTRRGFIETNIAFALQDPDIGDDIKRIIKKFAQEIAQELESAGKTSAAAE